ncbi:glycosyltransferase family 2 protein [Glycomyces sp. YM15]|uniref:glycosyltransferase family 2 protein n=1 Tax=Glycomyces sp. YM15 TaxID=2800446 RepID=UPI001963A59A|nr:glycosyltransferase family 2 protein [Glycomyces sp. YM15]
MVESETRRSAPASPGLPSQPTEPTADANHPDLLKRQLAEIAGRPPAAAYRSYVRTRSPLLFELLTKTAAPGHTYDHLLESIRSGWPLDADGFAPDYMVALAGAATRHRDFADGLALYRFADIALGAAITGEHQLHYAECAAAVGGSAASLLDRFDDLTQVARLSLEAEAVHPKHGGDEPAWLRHFGTAVGMEDLAFDPDPTRTHFDRLTTGITDTVTRPEKISIVMTCFRPNDAIFTAVDSIIAQTWQNWELIVVDDDSGTEFDGILGRVADRDKRIRVLRLPANSGTYRARNRAFAECKGTFITGFDSDDWAHPRWLERQAEPLLHDSGIVMTFASCARVKEDLTLINTGRPIYGPRSTSVLFRAKAARERMGFFDAVRKGADSEFHFRFKAAFGRRAVQKLNGEILTLIRLGADTLTSRDIGYGWQHPARFAYRSAHHHWRRRITAGDCAPYLAADEPDRPFYAPALIRGASLEGTRFDLLIVIDCRFWEASQQRAIALARKAIAEGLKVGVVHIETLLRLREDLRYFRPEILDFLNEPEVRRSGAEFVAAMDVVATDELVVSDPSLWEGREAEFGLTGFDRIEIWEASIAATVETGKPAKPKPAATAAAAPRRRVRAVEQLGRIPRRIRRRLEARALVRAAAIAVVLVCLLAASSWFWAGLDTSLLLTFAALAALLAAAAIAMTAPGFRRIQSFIDRISSK